jgi:hypothetical protein
VTEDFRFEIAFERDRIHVHGYDRARNPIDLQGVTGTVRVAYRDDRSSVTAALNYEPGSHGNGYKHDRAEHQRVIPGIGHLVADVSFALVTERDATAEFELENLPGGFEQRVEFTETFKLARLHEFFCPMACIAPPHDPGACRECGTALRIRRFIYCCSDHPLVTARDADETCWIDGQQLQKRPQRAAER